MVFALLLASPTPALAALNGPAGNAFYTPPSPLPAGSPGDVIWARTAPSISSSATAYKILYRSTDVAGGAIAVSGTILVPTAAWTGSGTRPLTAYASGTQGWADSCAPSREMDSNSFDEGFAVTNLLAKGWAVVVTDYPGLGTPGDHQYNVGISEGHAVAGLAARGTRLPEAGLSTTKMAVEGY